MSNYKNRNAVAALNAYLWRAMEVNLNFNKNDYHGLIPIIPTSQQPEIMDIGRPFIVYGSSRMPSGHLYTLRTETVSYTTYATTVSECNKIASLIADLFEMQDESAGNVNHYLSNKNYDVSFGSIQTIMIEKPEPADNDGGFLAATVLVTIKYVESSPNPGLTTRDFL